jgi:HTH-type transcriptional regulator/antitoxin HigA
MIKPKTDKARRAPAAPPDYLDLVAQFPLRPLGSRAQYDAAWRVAEPMVGRSDLTRGEQMYLDALSFFLEEYEQQHHAVKRPAKLTPVQLVKELMDLRGMTVGDLAKVIGSQPMASMILRGQRGISKTNIAKLSAHFRVDPAAFMEAAPAQSAPTPYRRAAG